jgi:SAM-dependent methyltransferase
MNPVCPLCKERRSALYHENALRSFWRCECCGLVFVPPEYLLTAEEEQRRYVLHENCLEDEGYCQFLTKLLDPMVVRLAEGAAGLDYGCGPGPVLAELFRRKGFACEVYDPFFYDDRSVLARSYDFVSCSEVIEHCYDPRQVLRTLLSLVRPGGLVGIMTQWVISQERFRRWRYIDDETHVCFFSPETWQWVAADLRVQSIEFLGNSITLLRR